MDLFFPLDLLEEGTSALTAAEEGVDDRDEWRVDFCDGGVRDDNLVCTMTTTKNWKSCENINNWATTIVQTKGIWAEYKINGKKTKKKGVENSWNLYKQKKQHICKKKIIKNNPTTAQTFTATTYTTPKITTLKATDPLNE